MEDLAVNPKNTPNFLSAIGQPIGQARRDVTSTLIAIFRLLGQSQFDEALKPGISLG